MEELEKRIEDLKKIIKELYDRMFNAGPGTIGDYKNAIAEKEKILTELELRRDAAQPGDNPTFYIYILTQIDGKIKAALDPQLYQLLGPPNHDERLTNRWKPFITEKETIGELLQRLKAENPNFEEIYLDQDTTDEQVEEIDQNIQNSVAIIDLLAVNNETEHIARRFDTGQIRKVITPIGKGIHNELEKFMESKRATVFRLLEFKFRTAKIAVDYYHPDTPRSVNLVQALLNIISKRKPITRSITDLGSDADLRLRNTTPTF